MRKEIVKIAKVVDVEKILKYDFSINYENLKISKDTTQEGFFIVELYVSNMDTGSIELKKSIFQLLGVPGDDRLCEFKKYDNIDDFIDDYVNTIKYAKNIILDELEKFKKMSSHEGFQSRVDGVIKGIKKSEYVTIKRYISLLKEIHGTNFNKRDDFGFDYDNISTNDLLEILDNSNGFELTFFKDVLIENKTALESMCM